MRLRHPGPFPFRWYTAGDVANAAAWEPFTFTLKQAMEYWWRLRVFTVEISATCTAFDLDPGGDQRTVTKTLTCTRYSLEKAGSLVAGDELYLCYPGQYLKTGDVAEWRGISTGYVSGGLWIGSSDPSGATYSYQATPKMFTPGNGGKRGTYGSVSSVKPACDLYFTIDFLESGSILDGPSCIISNIAPATGADSGTFNANFFGTNVPFFWEGNPGDYTFTWDSVTINTVTKTAWFPYEVSTGGAPVWDSATGAQLLDPRTASVP